MAEDTKRTLPIMYSISLYKIIEKMLFVGDTEGDTKPEERKLPFNVKYKLQRNLDLLLKDYAFYESERTRIIKEIGREEGDKIVVPEDKQKDFREELTKSLRIEVEHSFKRFTPEEVENFTEGVHVSCEEMNLFIAYMVEDEDLINDLNSDVVPVSKEGEDVPEVSEGSEGETPEGEVTED